ncbi:ABC transporter I family member 1, putative [Plasmodium gallinaceum]|uniref:ABC transporter I family member 1, putative n=1 Tax=Plasmodium gallinaceum TaxID=5849 RepID=A0A1J1GPP1_PLAGA|nr:ABC transporter I family member 1, putative [Plasmodium gallinaceum]CRG94262.1 ABC transporter I family member 1, putative [Plasmodium gallinaceum]
MKFRKLYGLIKKSFYEKRKNFILYFFFLLVPFFLIVFHIFLRKLSDKYSIEAHNPSKTNKIELNDSIRHYVLFLGNQLCSKQIDDDIYVNHICVTPKNNITNSFLSYVEKNDLNIFKIYKNEEDCLKKVKFAVEIKKSDIKNIKYNNYFYIKEQNLEDTYILNNFKKNIKYNELISLDDLYKNIYTKEEYNRLLNIKIDEDTLKEVKKTKLYKSFIKEIINFKDENYYENFFNDEKKRLFFINFVKNNLIETNFSCGLVAIQNENDLKKKSKFNFFHPFGKKEERKKNIYNSKNDENINFKEYNNNNDFNSENMENKYLTNVKNYNFKNFNFNKMRYVNENELINNITYKIRVGDYALLNLNDNLFFNDININLKQNFLNFNTIDDLSFNIYFNEWYYYSFFIVLEYYFNSFLLEYESNNLEYKKSMNIDAINKISLLRTPKRKLSLNKFFLFKMPTKIIKINAFDTFEKNIFRVIIFLCVCLFIASICFDINKERKMNIVNFLYCINVNNYYYYFSWLLFYFIMLFIYNIFFTLVIYLFVYLRLVNYFILFIYIYLFLMNSLLFTVICMQFTNSSSINYIVTFLLFFLFSSFRLIIHSGINKVLLFFVLLIPHSSFCLSLDFFFILIKNNMKVNYMQLFIKIESVNLMHLLLYSVSSFILLILILTFIIFYKRIRLDLSYIKKKKKNIINQNDNLMNGLSEDDENGKTHVSNFVNKMDIKIEKNIINQNDKLMNEVSGDDENGKTHVSNFANKMDIKIEKNIINQKEYNLYRNKNEIDNNYFYLLIENVNKYYGEKHVLKDISLCLKSNRIFVLLGENGSGKSTLINIITKMITKDSGKITFINNTLKKEKKKIVDMSDSSSNISNVSLYSKYIKGIFVNKINKKRYFKKKNDFKISYCSQNVILYDNLTFYETIKIFLLYYNKNVDKYLKKKRTLRILNDLDLEKYMNCKIKNLMDEIKKKISIFICFLVKQDIYILDEPFIALDIKTKMKLFNFFDKIKKKNIIFICTHDIYEANNFSDDIAIIKSGEIIFNGSKNCFQKLIDYKFILNIQFKQDNNEKIDYLSQEKVMLSLTKNSKSKKNSLNKITHSYNMGNNNNNNNNSHIIDNFSNNNNSHIIDNFSNNNNNNSHIILMNYENEKDKKNNLIKKKIIDFIKCIREENKNCFIFFNENYIYCTYKINEIESLKKSLCFLNKYKNTLIYQIKTIDIFYTYIYIYIYNEKNKLLKNVQDKDIRCLLEIDPLFYLYLYNFKYFNEQNKLLFSDNRNGQINLYNFNYLNNILVNNKISKNKYEEKTFFERKKNEETNEDNTDIREYKIDEDTKKINENIYLQKKNEKGNSLFKNLINSFTIYIKPLLLLKLKKDLSNKIFYWYKFLVPLLILSFGIFIIKCISNYGKIKNIKLDHNTLSSINLENTTLNYYIIYETEMNNLESDNSHKIMNMIHSNEHEDSNYRSLSLKEKMKKKKELNYNNVKNIIKLKNGYNFNRLPTNSFNYYNNTINTLLEKYCIKEKINYIDDNINKDNLYNDISNYLKRKSENDNIISLGSFVFFIKEKKDKKDITNRTEIEMNINLFYNYTSIHSYAYYMNSIFNIMHDFQNEIYEDYYEKEKKILNSEENKPYHFITCSKSIEGNHIYEQIRNDSYNISDYLSDNSNLIYENISNENDNGNKYTNKNSFLIKKNKENYEKILKSSNIVEIINEPFYIKYHEHFLSDFYINVYIFLSIVIFFCVLFERLKNEIKHRKIFEYFNVHKYTHYFQIFLVEFFYYFIYLLFLFMILYIFDYKHYFYVSYFFFLLLYGFNIFLSICLFTSLYLNSYIVFLFFNFIFCGIINIVIYVLLILSYAYSNNVLIYISHILVCIFRIFDSFSLSHSLNIRSLCLNIKRHFNYINGTSKNEENTLSFFNHSNKNNSKIELEEVMDICADSNIYFNIKGDFIFLSINCFVYLLLIMYKLLQLRNKLQKEKQTKNKRNISEGKYTFALKHFYLSNEKYKKRKMYIFFRILNFIKKCFSLKKKNKNKIYRKYDSFEVETNVSYELNEDNISQDNIIKYTKKLKENSYNNEKYIFKNLNIKMNEYQIYAFSTIFNNDLNILYFFKYFFCKNDNKICNYAKYNEENNMYNIDKIFSESFHKINENDYKITLIPCMSIYEHLKLIITFKKLKLNSMELKYLINLLMLIVNLKCNMNLNCNQLSGGMKKKVELMINLLKNDKIIFLYKLNDNIDFCSQIYINIILKNILLLNEYDSKINYESLIDNVSTHVELDEEKRKNIISINSHMRKKEMRVKKKESISILKEKENFINSNKRNDYLDCSITSNLKSANQNMIDSFIKQNILKIRFGIKNFAIYSHIYTDMLYYDYLYLFHKNEIIYNNYIQNIKNIFKNYYLFQLKLKKIPESKIKEYMNIYFSIYKHTFKKYQKTLINFFRNSEYKKKYCCNDIRQTDSIVLFLEKFSKNNSLTMHNLYYIFKTNKKNKYRNKKFFLSHSKFHKILFNLMIDKFSYLHCYLKKNKFISIFNLFKFVISEITLRKIQNFIFKCKGIKNISSEILRFNHYLFILKINKNRNFFKLLEINKRMKFNDDEIEVEHIDINNANANDIFLLMFKKLL